MLASGYLLLHQKLLTNGLTLVYVLSMESVTKLPTSSGSVPEQDFLGERAVLHT